MGGITEVKEPSGNAGSGQIVTYTIYNADNTRDVAWFTDDWVEDQNIVIPPKWDQDFKPWGVDDIRTIQDETCVIADEELQENQMFLIGSSLGMLIQRDRPGIWEPGDTTNRQYKFKIEETFQGTTGDFNRQTIPLGIGKATGSNKEHYLSLPDKAYGGAFPWSRGTIQQCAVGSITNSRPCDVTEIGIKSEVWRRMTGSINFNSMPTEEVIEEYEEDMAWFFTNN